MRRVFVATGALLALAACSSTTTNEPDCVVDGTYTLRYTTNHGLPGTCGTTQFDAETVTIATSGAQANVTFQGSLGDGCPGAFSRSLCRITLKCDGTNNKGSTSTMQVEWTFNDVGFTGSSDFAFRDPNGALCTSNQDAHGTRK